MGAGEAKGAGTEKKKKTGFIFSRGIPERAVSDRPEDVERTDALPDACDFIGSISGSGDLFCLVRIPDDGKQIYHGEQHYRGRNLRTFSKPGRGDGRLLSAYDDTDVFLVYPGTRKRNTGC